MKSLRRTFDWLTTHRWKVIAHGSILCLFLLYSFFLAVPLFDRFEGIEDKAKIHDLSLPAETNNVWCGFGPHIRMEMIELFGWAFIEGQNPENNQTYVVLKSARNTYVFETMIREEAQLNNLLNIEAPYLGWAGFVTRIDSTEIKDNVYDVGVYIINDTVRALRYMEWVLVKSGRSVVKAPRQSQLQAISLPEESGNINFSIDSLHEATEKETGTVFVDIEGWAFIEGQSSENSKVYVVLESSSNVYVFDTAVRASHNVNKSFAESNLNLNFCGFKARIAKNEMETGNYRASIYIKKDNIETLRYTDKHIEIEH